MSTTQNLTDSVKFIAEEFFTLNKEKYISDNILVALDVIIEKYNLELLGLFLDGKRFEHGQSLKCSSCMLVFKNCVILLDQELYTCFESDVKLTDKMITTSNRRKSIKRLYYNMLDWCNYKLEQEKNRAFLWNKKADINSEVRLYLAYHQM